MNLDDATTDALLVRIYSAAAGRIPWEPVLDFLAQMLDAWATHVFAVDKVNNGILFSHVGGHAAPDAHLDYLRRYYRIDPRTPLLVAQRGNDWLHCHEHFSDDAVARNPFYQDFLIPNGGRYVSGLKLVDDDDLISILGVHRGLGQHPLDAPTVRWIERLRMHLVTALDNYRHLAALQRSCFAGQALLDRMHQPMLLVDASHGLRHANAAGKAALASTRYIVDRGGILGCRNREDDGELAAAVHELGLLDGERVGDGKRYFRIHMADGLRTVGVCASAIRPTEVMKGFGTLPLALLIFHDPSERPEIDPFLLAEIFDLTPAESRVAALLALGKSAEEVAGQRAVAIGTVRAQIKSLLVKTGAQRQSDLVRILVTTAAGG